MAGEKKEHTGRERQDTARLLELDEAAERAGGLAARVRFVVREQSSDGMLGICQGLLIGRINTHPITVNWTRNIFQDHANLLFFFGGGGVDRAKPRL